METVIAEIIKLIQKSPLKKIKGECRFPTHGPDDFPPFDDKKQFEEFFEEGATLGPFILFSFNDQLIGSLEMKKNQVLSWDFGEDAEWNFELSDFDDELPDLIIFIKYTNNWPYIAEFGEFIAMMDPPQ